MNRHPHHDVLVVDPDRSLAACLTLYLQMNGFRTIATRGHRDTLEALRAGFRPCVVFADPRSSEAGAWEVVDYLRSDSILSRVPLVVVSDCPRLLRRAAHAGIAAVIAKPAPPGRWVDAVERQCRYRWWLRAPLEVAEPAVASGLSRRTTRQVSGVARVRRNARGVAAWR
jgi:DNA-binding NtrC family response regulator